MAYKTIYSKPTANKLPGSNTDYHFRTVTRYEVDSNGKATGKSTSQLYYTPVPGGRTSGGDTWTAGNENGENFNSGGYALAAESTDGGAKWTAKQYTQEDANVLSGIGNDRVGKNVLGTTALQSLKTPGGRFYNTAQNSIINTAVQTEAGLAPKVSTKLKNSATVDSESEEETATTEVVTEEDTTTETVSEEFNIGDLKKPARKTFGTLVFPTGLDTNKQDIIKFDILKYEPKKSGAGAAGAFNRNKRSAFTERSLGSVSLPIPSGISDSNRVDWGTKTMNPLQTAAMGIAIEFLSNSGESAANLTKAKVEDALKNTPELKTAATAYFAGAAIGMGQQVLQREYGAIFNPNMELLFNNPALRPFNFNFTLTPRSSDEAKKIVRIIRFFKEGMAVKRSSSGLFLQAPNTFKLRYLKGGGDTNHPYIGKIKECALKSFNVNYTPNGSYSTFTDGILTSYQISMQFTELEPVFADDYSNDGTEVPAEIGF